jgi:hypothetical protein
MPQDGMFADRYHGLRNGFTDLTQTCSTSTTENGNFHNKVLLGLVPAALGMPG